VYERPAEKSYLKIKTLEDDQTIHINIFAYLRLPTSTDSGNSVATDLLVTTFRIRKGGV